MLPDATISHEGRAYATSKLKLAYQKMARVAVEKDDTVKAILTAVIALLMTAIVAMLSWNMGRQDDRIEYAITVGSNNSIRITAVETRQIEALTEIRRQLNRIETEVSQ